MEEMIKDTEGYMPSMDLEKLAAESRADGGNDNISVQMRHNCRQSKPVHAYVFWASVRKVA